MTLQFARKIVGEARCRIFDWRHGVHTCGDVNIEGLTIVGDSAAHAAPYVPSHPKFLFQVLGGLGIEYQRYAMIDLGSGKGRVLLVASEFPFHQIIGVEFARELNDAASDNVRRYRSRTQQCRDIRTLYQDARDFVFPDLPMVVFLFNPFRPPVLVPVLHHLRDSLERSPRDVHLLYSGAFHGDLVEQETMLRCVSRSEYHNLYRLQPGSAPPREG